MRKSAALRVLAVALLTFAACLPALARAALRAGDF